MLNIEVIGEDGPAHVKGIIVGKHGIGKTSLIRQLDPSSTLLLDLEAGALPLRGWKGNRVDVFKEAQRLQVPVWELARTIAVWLGGPSPFVSLETSAYSKMHHDYACNILGDPKEVLANVKTVFVDSISVASRACKTWAVAQPASFNKKGEPNPLGTFGLVKDEMLGWLTQLQHMQSNVWLVGGLDRHDDDGRISWRPQVEGSGTANAMPGIVDQIVSYVTMKDAAGVEFRAFVCQTVNQWGYPAKDRSSALDMIEEPDLGKLMAKISASAPPVQATFRAAPLPVAQDTTTPQQQ